MRRTELVMCVCGLGVVFAGGCVSADKHGALEDTARGWEAQLAQCEAEVESLESDNARLRDANRAKDQAVERAEAEAQRIAERARQREEALLAELAALDSEVDRLDSDIDARLRAVVLDPATDRALSRLASQNPALMRYDSSTGTLQFTSDLTFASGSAEVRQQARESLRQLAPILTGANASQYTIEIVGHTDSQPISNPATRQRHADNRHLSVHRAISVGDALESFGVPARRIKTAGWGPHRPAVPNAPDGNTPANRRVDVRLTASDPMATFDDVSNMPAPAPDSENTNARRDFPVK